MPYSRRLFNIFVLKLQCFFLDATPACTNTRKFYLAVRPNTESGLALFKLVTRERYYVFGFCGFYNDQDTKFSCPNAVDSRYSILELIRPH